MPNDEKKKITTPTTSKNIEALENDTVFATFRHTPNHGACFTMDSNSNYNDASIGEAIAKLLPKYPILNRYLYRFSKKGLEFSMTLNHPYLRQANEQEMRQAFSFLIKTRFYAFTKFHEELFKKTEFSEEKSNSHACIRFNTLVETWQEEFQSLQKSFIADVLSSWFLQAITNCIKKLQPENYGQIIKCIEHGGEFVLVKNYPWFKKHFPTSFDHWSPSYDLLFSNLNELLGKRSHQDSIDNLPVGKKLKITQYNLSFFQKPLLDQSISENNSEYTLSEPY